MPGVWREYSPSVVVSLFLHGGFVVALVLMTQFSWHRADQSLHPLPVNAVVVDSRVLHAAEQAQADAAKAVQEAAAQRQRDEEAARQAALAEQQTVAQKAADAERQAEAEKAAAQKAAADRAAAERAAVGKAQQKAAADKAAADQAALEKAAAAARVAAAQKAAQAEKAAEAERAAAAEKAATLQKAADAKRAADQRAKAEREAELRRQLADEEHTAAVQSGPLSDQYRAALAASMYRAWNKPPSAGGGTDCRVEVTQLADGTVTNVRVLQCNGDAAVRQSVEIAVYKASPLPQAPDPALFNRVFVFEFKPHD
jgi:colicin import membrane protein